MLPLEASAQERQDNNVLKSDKLSNPRELKICSIQGRILHEKDVGSYIIRPQPKPLRLGYDWSWVPRQLFENFTQIKLCKINLDGTLEIFSEDWAARQATLRNDGTWLPVQVLKAHLNATGERLAILDNSNSGVILEKQDM